MQPIAAIELSLSSKLCFLSIYLQTKHSTFRIVPHVVRTYVSLSLYITRSHARQIPLFRPLTHCTCSRFYYRRCTYGRVIKRGGGRYEWNWAPPPHNTSKTLKLGNKLIVIIFQGLIIPIYAIKCKQLYIRTRIQYLDQVQTVYVTQNEGLYIA